MERTRDPRRIRGATAAARRAVLFATAAAVCAGGATVESAPASQAKTMKTSPTRASAHVSETVLENGLKVLIQEVHTAPVVAFMVWYRVGSRNETAGVTGISHLLEHMMFKGTPTLGKGEIARSLRKIGAAFNAGTSLDYTNYFEVLASEQLELAMRIESDRMVNALIPPEEHRLEMTVVRSELERNEDNPHRALYLETFAQAFKAHPYHWPTIGWRSDVESITTDQIRAHYKAHYVPNNATVVIVGDVTTADALAMAKRYFGSIPKGPDPPPVRTVEPPQLGERRFKIRKPGDTRYLMVSYRTPELIHQDTYALDVLGMILGHGKTSRLYQALVEGKLATEAEAANESSRDPFLLIAQATAAPGVELAALEAALVREVERLRAEPVSAQELKRAKKQLQAAFVYNKDSIRSLARQLGYYETVASYRFLDTYPDEIARVTQADVQRVARTYLIEDSRTVGLYEPTPADRAGSGGDGAAGPGKWAPGSDVNAVPGGAASAAPYRGAAEPFLNRPSDDGAGAASPAAGAAAGSRAKPAATLPARVVLPNGLVLILQENHANPTVAIHGIVKAGAMYDPPGRGGLARFVAGMLDRGTRTRSALEQATAIENVAASLEFAAETEFASISGGALTEDLGTVLTVLADALVNPAFPPDQIGKARDELITQVRIADNSTSSVAARTANEMLFPETHPFHRAPSGTVASLEAITREDLAAFHARHYGPNLTTLVLVGDVHPTKTVELVKQALGGWKRLGAVPAYSIAAAPAPTSPLRRTVPMPGKSQADIALALPGLTRNAPDYYPTLLVNQVLGGGGLSSRLMDALRDQQGLVYGVSSNLTPGIGAGPIQVRAGTNPANVERATTAMLEQLRRMHDDGPTAEELVDAKGYLTGVFPVRLETNAGVAGQLLGAELYGLGMDYIQRYGSIIRGVTLEQTRTAAREHLKLDAHALVVAGTVEEATKP